MKKFCSNYEKRHRYFVTVHLTKGKWGGSINLEVWPWKVSEVKNNGQFAKKGITVGWTVYAMGANESELEIIRMSNKVQFNTALNITESKCVIKFYKTPTCGV
eukprot:UN10746